MNTPERLEELAKQLRDHGWTVRLDAESPVLQQHAQRLRNAGYTVEPPQHDQGADGEAGAADRTRFEPPPSSGQGVQGAGDDTAGAITKSAAGEPAKKAAPARAK